MPVKYNILKDANKVVDKFEKQLKKDAGDVDFKVIAMLIGLISLAFTAVIFAIFGK